MSISLLIDTSHGSNIGLLDFNFNWIEFSNDLESKSSGIIHHRLHELLTKNKARIEDLQNLFLINGPGSYTGVRVGEGIGQIFEWQNINTFSFHHFQIPYLGDVKEGIFICSAFKNEYFVYHWKDEINNQSLVSLEKLMESLKEHKEYYSYSKLEGVEFASFDFIDTNEILRKNSIKILSKVFSSKLREKPFYFRKLSDEFKKKES